MNYKICIRLFKISKKEKSWVFFVESQKEIIDKFIKINKK